LAPGSTRCRTRITASRKASRRLMHGWTGPRKGRCTGPMTSTRAGRVRWCGPRPLLAHFRRLARDVRHDLWPTPEAAVLQQPEWRAVHEGRRPGGRIAVPPYRFEYVDAMSTWPQWDDIFIHESLDFDSDVPSPRILDCGANIGLASIYFKGRYPHAQLTAFEPDPRLASICRSNLAGGVGGGGGGGKKARGGGSGGAR